MPNLMNSTIYFDVDRQSYVTSTTPQVYRDKSTPFLYYGNKHLWKIHLLRYDGTYYSLADGEFKFYLDKDYNTGTNPLVSVTNSDIDVTADWSESDPTAGKISVKIDTDNNAIETYIGNSIKQTVYYTLWYKPSGATRWNAIVTGYATLRNVIYHPDAGEDMSSGSSESSESSSSSVDSSSSSSDSSDSSISSESSDSSDSSDSSESSLSSVSSDSSESSESSSSSIDSSSSSSEIEARVYVASGFGSVNVNGSYTYNGTVNGRPSYVNGIYSLEWDGSQWIIEWGGVNYSNATDSYLPPLTGWVGIMGTPPAGTFT